MSRARIVQQAQDEIAAITDYITFHSPAAAERFVNRLFDLLETLASQPSMGEQRPDLSEGLHSFSFGSYVLYFRPMNDGIRVLHLIHGARDISAIDFDLGA